MIKDNGGSAFPDFPIYGLEYEIDEEGGVYSITHDQQSLGMSLRDYFAAKAMQALLRQYPDHLMNSPSNEVACDAYSMADAMLKAREA